MSTGMMIENTFAPTAFAAAAVAGTSGYAMSPLVKGMLIGGFTVAAIVFVIWMISEYEKDHKPVHQV